MEDNGKRWFGILALDGGGIRGVIPASVLVAIEKLTGRPIAETFDMVVGTSTGGIISLALTFTRDGVTPAMTARDVLGLYDNQENASKIFRPWLFRDPFEKRGSPVPAEFAVFNPKYKTTGLQELLTDTFGDARLGGSLIPVSCVSYRVDGAPAPFFFRSWEAKKDPDQDFPIVEVGRATGAAPVYFPPVTIRSAGGGFTGTFVDGGVAANDPALVAVSEAASLYGERHGSPGAAFQALAREYNVWLLSVGTGAPTVTIDPGDCGAYGWLDRGALLSVLMDGPAQTTELTAPMLLQPALGLNYRRVQVPLAGTVPSSGKQYSCSTALDSWTEENIENLLLAGQAAADDPAVAETVRVLGNRARVAAPEVGGEVLSAEC
jgi:hypothetical protein